MGQLFLCLKKGSCEGMMQSPSSVYVFEELLSSEGRLRFPPPLPVLPPERKRVCLEGTIKKDSSYVFRGVLVEYFKKLNYNKRN